MADAKDLKLKDIDEIREYFKKGFLEITPETYSDIATYAASYKKAFKAYNKGLSLKGWNDQNNLKGLSKLLSYFNAVKEVKCRKNAWQEKTIINTLGNAIQYYEKLEALDLKDMSLNDKAVLKLLKALPKPDHLQTLNIKTSTLSLQSQSEIKTEYPNIAKLIVGTETPIAKAEIKIEKVDEPKTPALKPLYSPEEMTKASAPAQPTRKLTQDDIKEALQKVKTNTLSWTDFAAFISSDPTLTTLSLSYNLIGAIGATALAPSLKGMTALTTLDLHHNQIGDEGATALAPSLKGMTALTKLNLNHNQIGDAGIMALAPSLKGMTVLNHLYLNSN